MGPKRNIKRNYTNAASDTQHWDERQTTSVYSDEPDHISREEELVQRASSWNASRDDFVASFQLKRKRGRCGNRKEITKCLQHWLKYESWGVCSNCSVVSKNSLLPRSLNSRGCKFVSDCLCSKQRYIIPEREHFPAELGGLSKAEEEILRIFNIDIGLYQRERHGSRTKTGAFEVRYRPETVLQRIEQVKISIYIFDITVKFCFSIEKLLKPIFRTLIHLGGL